MKAFLTSNKYTTSAFIDIKEDSGSLRHVDLKLPSDKILEFGERWYFHREKPNVLVLNEWVQKQGFSEGVGWFNMLGGTVTQEAVFYIDGEIPNLRAVFDKVPEPHQIEINNTLITRYKPSTYLDHQMKEADISHYVCQGRNVLKIEFTLPERAFQGKTGIKPIELMFDPVMIIGDFSLEKRADGNYVLVKEKNVLANGSWTKQGYPFYAGSIEYRQQIYIDDSFITDRRCFLEIDDLKEVMELTVNEKTYSPKMWEPYCVDITESLKPGLNDFRIRVWNTLTNLLDFRDFDSGITGKVRIISKPQICVSL